MRAVAKRQAASQQEHCWDPQTGMSATALLRNRTYAPLCVTCSWPHWRGITNGARWIVSIRRMPRCSPDAYRQPSLRKVMAANPFGHFCSRIAPMATIPRGSARSLELSLTRTSPIIVSALIVLNPDAWKGPICACKCRVRCSDQ